MRQLLKHLYHSVRRAFRASSPGSRSRHLHLGCANVYIPGYCNVDIDPASSADVVDDILRLRRFGTNYADSIYACHVLEHVSHREAPIVLSQWFRVLKPGGELRISVPDLDRIVKIYQKNWEHFQTPGHAPWIGLIYGGQEDPYDYHKTGFNFCWMKHLLTNAGFAEIIEYPHEPHFLPSVRDASLAKEPFEDFLSLNVFARKPRR